MELSWGGGGGEDWIGSCAFFWQWGVIQPIYEACTDDVDATIAIGQFFPVILAFPRLKGTKATRTGVTKFKSSRRYLV